MSKWLEKATKTFKEISGYELTKEDLVAFEEDELPEGKLHNTETVSHFPRLVRLHQALESAGVQERGRLVEIVSATGYSRQQVSRFLTGVTPMPQHFAIAVCRAYKLDFEHIWSLGVTPAVLETLAKHHEKTLSQEIGHLDAPTQEIVKEICRLSESNRWVFVGRAKAIIEEMLIEERARCLKPLI